MRQVRKVFSKTIFALALCLLPGSEQGLFQQGDDMSLNRRDWLKAARLLGMPYVEHQARL
jgi:hypothetical protein